MDNMGKKLVTLDSEIETTNVELSNTFNKFLSLGNKKFIDNVTISTFL